MELSDAERLIIANQYKILSLLNDNKNEKESYSNLERWLQEGYEFLYKNHPCLSVEPIFSKDKSDFVCTILELYDRLQQRYETLKDKGKLTKNNVLFPGFDGNHEGEYMCFTKELRVSDRFNYVELKNPDCNSHLALVDKYHRMIEKSKEIGEIQNADDIQQILNA